MISCTEFIPLYSEFFKFLDEQGGHDAVVRYWEHISDYSIGDKTNPYSLASYLEREGGLDGAWAYWNRSLSEEACDVLRIYNKDEQYIYSEMRQCPSRGMLNALGHIEPYYDYCEHCNVIYKRVLEQHGIMSKSDRSQVEHAKCSSLRYLKGHEPKCDYTKPDENMIVVDIKKEDNKYLHRDFHLSGDLALKYCGDEYGENCVCSFLTKYANNYYSPQIADIKERGLVAVEEWIKSVYEIEEASELLHTEMTADVLKVTVDKSPAIAFMRQANQEPSRYYIEQTRTLYSAVADACDLGFTLDYYREDGGCEFRFFVRKYIK